MKRIVLISCVKTKLDHPAKAENLYISDLFVKNLAYAKKLKPDYIFILSAKYGLVKLNDRIAPYEKTLNQMPVHERRAWASGVVSELRKYADLEQDEFIILAGEKYREFILPYMRNYKIPFEGLSFGNQLKALKEVVGF
jgi:cytoplasmic iron level regulating protein YaaA (DUF328/UPF0246 family)